MLYYHSKKIKTAVRSNKSFPYRAIGNLSTTLLDMYKLCNISLVANNFKLIKQNKNCQSLLTERAYKQPIPINIEKMTLKKSCNILLVNH